MANCAGREKLSHREADLAEQAAGILTGGFPRTPAGAFFFRHAVVVHGNQQLRIPLQTHDGELAQSHVHTPHIVSAGQFTVEETADKGRHLAQIAVTGAAAAGFHQLRIQHNGIDSLHHSGGQIVPAHILGVRPALAELRGEDFGVALAAEQQDALVKHAQALHRHWAGIVQVRLQRHLIEKAHIDGIETPVKCHRLHIHIHVEQLCTATLHGQRMVNGIYVLKSWIKTQILYTIFIMTTGVLKVSTARPISACNKRACPWMGLPTPAAYMRNHLFTDKAALCKQTVQFSKPKFHKFILAQHCEANQPDKRKFIIMTISDDKTVEPKGDIVSIHLPFLFDPKFSFQCACPEWQEFL